MHLMSTHSAPRFKVRGSDLWCPLFICVQLAVAGFDMFQGVFQNESKFLRIVSHCRRPIRTIAKLGAANFTKVEALIPLELF